MESIPAIRPSPIAGLWYSERRQELADEIDTYLARAELPQLDGEVIGVIAPHAGFRYSGATAGYAFRAVQGKSYDVVVILSPFHAYQSATIISSAHQAYATPLGAVPIAQDLLSDFYAQLEGNPSIRAIRVMNDDEHSQEIELPFLQRALSQNFLLLPLMIRTIAPSQAKILADTLLKSLAGKKVLLVASTDLSHFYSQATAEQLDETMLASIASFSVESVYQTELNQQGFACGLGAVMTAMQIAKNLGADQIQILHHSTSAAETGDFSSVVGYGSAVFLKNDTPDLNSAV